MRKMVCLILTVLMMLTVLSACSGNVSVDDDFLIETADAMTADLIELGKSERVLEMVMGGNQDVLNNCAVCAAGLEEKTKEMTVLSISSDDASITKLIGSNLKLTDKEKAIVRGRYHISNSFCSMADMDMGSSWVAAFSVLTVSGTFRCSDMGGQEYIVVMKKAGDYSVIASAYETGDGVVNVSARPISTSSVDDLLKQAKSIGFEVVE